ncbi:MAG: carboxypeptidase regulatory-like domain-containing protein [Marinicellaceae bacterium]
MKLLLALLVFTASSTASELSQKDTLFTSIQQQISEIENIKDKFGKDKIGTYYLRQLKEYKAALAQQKAHPKNHHNSNELSRLSLAIDNLLGTEDNVVNALKTKTVNGTENGIIRGIVRGANTNEIIINSPVYLYDSSGNNINLSFTDNSGRFLFNNVAAGQYALINSGNSNNGYIHTAYPNKPCPSGLGFGCQISDLTLVDLAESEVRENVNIYSMSNPVISGQLVDSDNGFFVRYATVKLYDSFGNYITQSSSNDLGQYQIAAPIEGSYYLIIEHSLYQLQLYGDVICNQVCDLNSGELIAVEYNQNLEDIDFLLKKNSMISGNVINGSTNQGLSYATIFIIDESGQVQISTNTQSSSSWSLPVPIGNYSIIAEKNYNNYLATKHQNHSCLSARVSSCDYVSGTVVNHGLINTENIELAMVTGADIKGVITDTNNQPIQGVELFVYYAVDNQLVEQSYSVSSNELGEYSVEQLGNGSYYLVAADDSYVPQIFNGVNCLTQFDCNFNVATPVVINNLTDANGIDFQLKSKSSISGTIVDYNNDPIESVLVKIRDEFSNEPAYSYTNSEGNYHIDDIPAGTYQLYARSLDNTFFAESYDDIQCIDYLCRGDEFTPISLDDSHLDIDFQLSGNGSVSVDLISNSPNPVYEGFIYVVDESGNNKGVFYFSEVITLPEGDYYFHYQSNFNQNYKHIFVPKVYGGNNCFSICDATTGTLVHISENSEQILTMNLDEYFSVNVTASPDNNAFLRIYEEDFSDYYQTNIYNQENIPISNLGNKYFKLSKHGYFSQVYNGINCIDSTCDLTQGDFITPQLNSSVTINFDLSPLASLSGVVTDENNNPVSGRRVSLSEEINPLYDSLSETTDINGEYSFDAIPIGDYYLRVQANDNSNGLEWNATTYFGDIACDESDCGSLALTPITLNANSYLDNYDIQMIKRGTVSGSGIENVFGENIPVSINIYKVVGDSYSRVDTYGSDVGILYQQPLKEGEYKIIGNPGSQNLLSAYPGYECPDDLDECIALSDSIFVTNGNNTHFNAFTIHQYGQVKVVVKDAVSNISVNNPRVVLYKVGQTQGQEYTQQNEDSEFTINIGNSGSYRAFIYDEYFNQSYYIAQLYNGIDCLDGIGIDCNLDQGQEFMVASNTINTLNIYLTPRPKLKLSLVDAVSGHRISSKFSVYDSNLNRVYDDTNSYNEFSHYVDYLKPGSYFAIAEPRSGSDFATTGFPNSSCGSWFDIASCDDSLMPFEISRIDGVAEEINIEVGLLRGISGYVTDFHTGEPLQNIIIDYWNSSGFHSGTTSTSDNGGFSLSLNNGDYYLSTDTNNSYINEVFLDIPCASAAILGDCDVMLGVSTNVPSDNAIPIIVNIELEKNDPIFANSFE